MQVISRNSALWSYLTDDLRGLITDGENLLEFADDYKGKVSDYSFLVFPFAKAYEGFLKNLFLDLDLMREDEFYGDDIRIGRILNPSYMNQNYSTKQTLCLRPKGSKDLSTNLWNIWKKGRNLVFHYFPHNFRRLSLNEALEIIHDIIGGMDNAIGNCRIEIKK